MSNYLTVNILESLFKSEKKFSQYLRVKLSVGKFWSSFHSKHYRVKIAESVYQD